MLFVGDREAGYFVEEAAKKKNIDFAYVPINIHIQLQTNEILEFQKQDYTVFDIAQYIDDADTITDEINRICNANGSKPIIYASGYVKNSKIVMALRESGIRYFILGNTLLAMKDQLEKCMNGYYDVNEVEEIDIFKEQQKKQEQIQAQRNLRFIAVAGACNRIGTTTHAIQIVKYLLLKGYKACYIELNNTGYVSTMKEWFQIDNEDNEIGKVTFAGVDHFYLPEKLPDVLKLDYEYFVYDYGVYLNQDFNRISFLEKDIKVFVVGSDPTELPHTYKLIKNAFYDDVKYIFNFSSPDEKNDIEELMDEKKDVTYIAGFIPDKYIVSTSDIYGKIIPLEEKTTTGKKKKRRFFR